jgi:methyl-accepting chemotaxis protein
MSMNGSSQLKNSSADTRLAIITLQDRLPIFDPDGHFSASLAEAWDVIKDVSREQAQAAGNMLMHHPSFKAIFEMQSMDALLERGMEITRHKFTSPLNQEWINKLVEVGVICKAHNAPTYIAVATVYAGSTVFRSAAIERLKNNPTKLKRVIQTISQLEVLEIELIIAMMSQLDAQEEQNRLTHHSEEFEQKVMATVNEIAAFSAQLRTEAETAAGESCVMLKRSTDVVSSTNQSSSAMREATKLTAQLSDVIDTTHEGIGRASRDAAGAARQSETTMNTVMALAQNAKEIESVLSLIKNIAGQTNLLALNATIEAARAGDAGRGFSVVAQEVKMLAGQVAKATDEIAKQIASVQLVSEKAVVATQSIAQSVAEIHSNATQMQSTIDYQRNSVLAIRTAVEETASSADDVALNIETMRTASERMANKMAEINNGTVSVDTMLAKLRSDIDMFRLALKAA